MFWEAYGHVRSEYSVGVSDNVCNSLTQSDGFTLNLQTNDHFLNRHIDGNYKLVRWRMVFHGCVDGFS